MEIFLKKNLRCSAVFPENSFLISAVELFVY